MDPIPQTDLRPARLREVMERYSLNEKVREVAINPDGGFFDAKDLPSALRRMGTGRRLLLPPGEHQSAEITKPTHIRGSSAAPVVIKGTLSIKSDHAVLIGLELRAPEAGKPALDISSGTVILDGCTIKGEIKVGPGTSLFLRSCIVIGGEEAISATKAYVEIHTSRIADAQIGLALRDQASGAIYHSQIQRCVSTQESDWGAGILAKASEVYCEAVTFTDNGVGLYLTDNKEARLFSTHFLNQQASSLISVGPENSLIALRSCVIEGQTLSFSPQINVTGGRLDLTYVTVKIADVSALATNQVAVTIASSQLVAEKEIALDLQGGSISATHLTCVSHQNAALRANGCSGEIRDSGLTGLPPAQLENSPALSLQDCRTSDYRPEEPVFAAATNATSSDVFIKDLISEVSQESVRAEMERILRMAHAARERSLSGMPMSEQSFHSIFTGSPDTGKFTAARTLAKGLFSFGMTTQPDAEQIDISDILAKGAHGDAHLDMAIPSGGTFLVATPKTGFNKDLREIRRILERMVQAPGTVVILDGQREEMRFLIRSSHILERAFRHTLHFPDYGPIELMSLFTQLCKKDHITLKHEAAMGILMLFHTQCDRKDRRLTTTEGVEALYDAARQRYLERCSRFNRFDLPLEPQDLDIFHEKGVRFALDRNPAFASFCPECSKENPWVHGLGSQTECFHCGTVYEAGWGLWKDSASYRRLKDALANTPAVGIRVRRVNLSHLTS